ncbi:MAG: rhodanese-like domain-containing protein [Gemmatimonadales bacterium]|jgi:hydroxyacylglutathione hydrolase
MLLRQIFDDKLAQYAYLVGCQATGEALVIDPERDIDRYVELAESEGLTITTVTETHIHADFLSGAREFAERFGTKLYLSDEGDANWKYEWVKDGDYDYELLKDGDTFRVGNISVQAVHTPGHTPEHMVFLITDEGGGADEPIGLASGDFVFVGDLGRPDLLETAAKVEGMMEPSARRLYSSVQDFLKLPDYLQVWPAHGAGSACGKALGAVPETTVGYERRFSPAIEAAMRGEDAFVDFILTGQPEPPTYFARMKRDNKLGAPVLGNLPSPRKLARSELEKLSGREDLLVVDTRLDRDAYMARHLEGSLYAPLDRAFSQVVGSLVEDETTPLFLVVREEDLDEAVRSLVRIGYDNVAGFVEPEALEAYFIDGGAYDSIDVIDFADLESARKEDGALPLDVRFSSEFEEGRVPGALNTSYTRLPEYEPRIPENGTLLVYCRTGSRAAAAASYLKRQGFDVRYVDDLIADYPAIGPLETTEAAEPAAV